MTIYLDAVVLLNFLLDLMLLLLTRKLAKDATGTPRIMFGAFVASLLVPIMVYYPESFLTSFPGKLLYSLLIVLCSFKIVSIYKVFKRLLLFYFTTFAIGGGLIAVHFLLQSPIKNTSQGLLTFHKGYGDPVSWLFVIAGFPIVWHFTKSRMDKHMEEMIRYDQLCGVTIQIKGIHFDTTAYIDSGNQLSDPLTDKPVIVCDESFFKQWFTETEWDMLRTANNHLDFNSLPSDWETRIHIVPFQGIEGTQTMMLAVKPDFLTVLYENKEIKTDQVLIGIQFAKLSQDASYHCLLHPKVIQSAVPVSA